MVKRVPFTRDRRLKADRQSSQTTGNNVRSDLATLK
jgi:hypothetical protein